MTDALPFVSVIVLNYNGKSFLDGCLSSLSQIDYPSSRYEVIMVDNGSIDDSIEYVKKNFPWVNIVALDRNYGFGIGNNRGVKHANGGYIAFLNNDTEVTNDWLMRLVKASINHSVPICASKTLFMENPYVVEYGGAKFAVNGRGYSIAFGKEDSEEFSCTSTGYPCAAAMLIRRDVFLRIGQFDEDFFACLDDTDLGWRAWLYGYKVLYCPTSIVFHLAGGTTGRGRISPLKAFHATKNAVVNLLTNSGLGGLLQGVILALVYDFVEFLFLVKCKDVKCVKNKIKAYCWIVKNLKSILRKRYITQRKRVVSDKWLLDNGLMASFKEAIHEYLRLSQISTYSERFK